MSQKNQVKPRLCEKCGKRIDTTAAGIKEHATFCGGR